MQDVDQRGFDNPPSAAPDRSHLDGRAAAALLGVKRETLYAYASRGLVRSVPSAEGRARRYLRADLERLRARRDARSGHGPVAASALRWGEPVLESAISAIVPGGPSYRGRLAVDLAGRDVPFERVAELLWAGVPPDAAGGRRQPWEGVLPLPLPRAAAAAIPRDAHPFTALALATPLAAAADAARYNAPLEVELARARRLLVAMASWLALGERARARWQAPARPRGDAQDRPVARGVLEALRVPASPRALRAVNRALVLCADHELNPSSFAARVAASTGADLYACVTAALATLTGPRHGGACDRVEALLEEVGRPERARDALGDRCRRGEAIPGFGHPLYPAGDPRATPLLAVARALGPRAQRSSPGAARVRGRSGATLAAVVAAMRELGHEPPTIDVGLVAVASALGLPRGSAAGLFAVGRAAGWIAHVVEQRQAGYLLRPRARYVGPEPSAYADP